MISDRPLSEHLGEPTSRAGEVDPSPAIVGTPLGAAALWLWAASVGAGGRIPTESEETSICVALGMSDVLLGPERQ